MTCRFIKLNVGSNKMFISLMIIMFHFSKLFGSGIYVGSATVDISPQLPVALDGQFHLRIADKSDTPLQASILAIESRVNSKGLDTVVFVSCDLVGIADALKKELRNEVHKRIPGFNTSKIILNATHTHTAPVTEDNPDKSFIYKIPDTVQGAKQYRDLFVEKVSEAIVQAWETRSEGSVSWGLTRAAVGYNRRAVYTNGKSVMYGNAEKDGFINIEGYEDHDIHSMFFWNSNDELIAACIDVACPAQEVEHRYSVNADYWHPVREQLRSKFGNQLNVISWIGAAGDQSPHLIYRKTAENRMRDLWKEKYGSKEMDNREVRMQDIAERIVWAVERTFDLVRDERVSDLSFRHIAKNIELPMRIITKEEADESQEVVNDCRKQMEEDPKKSDQLYAKMTWYRDVVRRYNAQQNGESFLHTTEIHVLRIGDVAVTTNQFELFTDYGIRIQSRSPALQTIVVQLAGAGTYLPTEKAKEGGGYSAVCQSNLVGPEGGAILVEQTLNLLDQLWN